METLAVTVGLPVASVIVGIAVAWGIIRAEVSHMKELIKEFQDKVESLAEKAVMKEHCRDNHGHAERRMDEMKQDLKEIKNLLLNYFGKHPA